MSILALRLKPGEDLRLRLKEFAIAHQIQAGFILSAIGSFSQAAIRFADQPQSEILTGRFELLSLSGMLSVEGMHLHGAIADSTGKVIGGHIDYGCIIYTTAEIAIGTSNELVFSRTLDPQTGFLELEIKEQLDG